MHRHATCGTEFQIQQLASRIQQLKSWVDSAIKMPKSETTRQKNSTARQGEDREGDDNFFLKLHP